MSEQAAPPAAPAAPAGPARVQIPETPQVPPTPAPAPMAPPQATGDGQLTTILPPHTVDVPVAAEAAPTLEEQAQQQAAEAPPEHPPVAGSDIQLGSAFGQDWQGKTAADLYAAWKETRGALTQAQQQLAQLTPAQPPGQPPAAPPATPPQQAQPPQVPQVPQVPQPGQAQPPPPQQQVDQYAGFNAAVQRYAPLFQAQGGQLTQEQIQAFAGETGIPPHAVGMAISGAVAQAAQDEAAIYTQIAGDGNPATGKRNYEAMVSWMERNVHPDIARQFNAALDSNDLQQIQFAVQGMYSAFQQAGGAAPQFIQGTPPGHPSGAIPFQNWDEYRAVAEELTPQGHRRYDVDPNFRAEIAQRLQVSNL